MFYKQKVQVVMILKLNHLNQKLNTCEYIIECGNDNVKDYHQQMDFEKYVKWFENRLINTFN